jgi:hypothetical protein
MKKTLQTLTFATVTMCLVPTLDGCNAQTAKVVAKSAIDIGLASCIELYPEIQDEGALKELCRWTDEMAPLVKELLSARRMGHARASKMGAPVCTPAPATK